MQLKVNVKSVFVYIIYGILCIFCNLAMQGVPLSLGLCFSMLVCGTNIIAVPVIYALSSVVNLSLTLSVISLFCGAFMCAVTFLYRRYKRKMGFESVIYLFVTLTPYTLFAPVTFGADLVPNIYILRAAGAALALIFTYFAFRSVYALLFRIGRCRLKEDELVCLAVVYSVCGAGLYTALGRSFYLCVCAFIILSSVRLMRSPAALIFALVASIPPAVFELDLIYITAFTVISTVTLLFSSAGRYCAGGVCFAAFTAFFYFSGEFNCSKPLIAVYVILLFFACLFPTVPQNKSYEKLKRRLLVQDVLTETAVARSRMRTGERLYRISEVFREIECAFLALDEDLDDASVRERMFSELKEKCCKNCERAKRCAHSGVYAGFKRLIDCGSVKGKVNLIDLPSDMTTVCSRPSDVMAALNTLLAEYRRCSLERENARSGRRLLSEQAHGVAEVMKSCAVDLSRAQQFDGAAKEVVKALAAGGISCPELYIDGEYGNEICAVMYGKTNIKQACAVISKTLNKSYVLKDTLNYGANKRCYIFTAKPALDAAFGVAYAIKSGEKVSGDTHSVIKINEHSFLMALSDGMGSGKYARSVSEAAISLIEAFYRAEMPENTVLNTVNKLLSFNRDERFTCIDIAAVNLDTGRADFVKIGSPAGIILREGELKIIESDSLPLGILDNLHPATCSEMLKSGDIVVFMSDGITSAFGSATDLYEYLQGLKPLNPQNLADTVLAEALDRTGHSVTDDMTVVCTRLFES